MKVYVISVLHTCVNEQEKEVIASMPIAVFTDKQHAIKTMQEYMESKEGSLNAPIYNMYRHGSQVSCSFIEEGTEGTMTYHSEVTLKTIETDNESFDIGEAVIAAWN